MAGTARTTRLPDGRALHTVEYGDPGGLPVVFLPGTPAAAKSVEAFDDGTRVGALGLRLISVDRPGLGRSDPAPDRVVTDLVADLDALELDQPSVFALSGGCPYAMAWAAARPVRKLAVVAGMGPWSVPSLVSQTAELNHDLLEATLSSPFGIAALVRGDPGIRGQLVAACKRLLPPVDQSALDRDPGLVVDSLLEAVARGTGGARVDLEQMTVPWTTDLAAVRCPTRLWYGTEDRHCPVVIGEWLAERIDGAVLTRVAGEGHLSIAAAVAEPVLGWLAA